MVALLVPLSLGLLQLQLLVLQGHKQAGAAGQQGGVLLLCLPQLGFQSLLLPPAALSLDPDAPANAAQLRFEYTAACTQMYSS